MDNAAIARIHGPFRDSAGRDAGQDVLLALFGIAGEQSGLPTIRSVQPGFTTSGDTANFGARARTGERASRDYDQRAGKSVIGVMARP